MNNIGKIKLYIKITRPPKWLFCIDTFIWIFYYLVGIFISIPSSKAITSITISDLQATIKWLIIVMCLIIVMQLLLYFEHYVHHLIIKNVWNNIQEKIYDKINYASMQGLRSTSKEKLTNILYFNMADLASFPRDCAKYISYFLQLIITVCILTIYNWIIGISMIVLPVIVFAVKNAVYKKISYYTNQYYFYQDKSLENLSENYSNRVLTAELDISKAKRQVFYKNIEKSLNNKYKSGMLYCFDQVWLAFLCNLIVFALSLFIISLVKSNILSITLYLILTNYLYRSISQIYMGFDIISSINDMYVSLLRVKTIFELAPQDMVAFGNNITDNIKGELIFSNISYNPKDNLIPNLETFNISISKNSATLFWGSPKCGKRTIFKFLNRCIYPSSGTITIDNISIYDYSAEAYKHNIGFIFATTSLLNDSIMNNLLISGASKQQIYKICKDLGLHLQIVALQNSYNTNLSTQNAELSNFDMYLLGIARALATNSEILVFYEFPSNLNSDENSKLKSILKKLSKTHTVIVFSHDDWTKFFCKTICKVENGKIIQQTMTN